MMFSKLKAPYGAFFLLPFILASCTKQEVKPPVSSSVGQRGMLFQEIRAFHDQHEQQPYHGTCAAHVDNQPLKLPKSVSLEAIAKQEAKLIDIPIPIGAQVLESACEINDASDHMVLGYTTSLDYNTLIAFYQREMERLGWQQLAYVSGSESLLTFIKPGRFCSVFLRQHVDGGWRKSVPKIAFIIFVGPTT